MKKKNYIIAAILSLSMITAGAFPIDTVSASSSRSLQSSSENNEDDQEINFDHLLGQTYEYDDGTMCYQLIFNGSAGNISASMGTFSSGGSGTGGISFEIVLRNGTSRYENVDTYVAGYGMVESNNSVILLPGEGKVQVSWIDASGQTVVNADFLLVSGSDSGNDEEDGTSVSQNQTDSMAIAVSVKNMSYIGNKIYPLTAGRNSNNELAVSSVGQTGILYAAEHDLDEDGSKEILAVTYEPSSQIPGENTIHLSILKQNEGSWDILTEAEVVGQKYGDTLYDVSFMNDSHLYYEGSVFLRKYNGKYEIFYEYYGEGMFATGQTWFMRGFRFDNDTLSVIPETENIFYEGSPITMLWDGSYSELDDGTYGEMLNNYCSLGFQQPNISFEHMTMDQNTNLYLMLRLILGSDSTKEEVASLVSKGGILDTLWYDIQDYSEALPENIMEFQTQQGAATVREQTAPTSSETDASEYILPESNTRYLDASEVSSLGEENLQRAINEIYARHGRVFTTPENDAYFRSKSWYQPVEGKTDEQIEAEFNEFEKANVDLMNRYR